MSKGLDLEMECWSYGVAFYTATAAALITWVIVRRHTRGGYNR